jgi:TrmH family RNA methyltransferase
VLREARALHVKKQRRERRRFLAEGEDLVFAALAGGARLRALVVDEERVAHDDPILMASQDLAERYCAPHQLIARASTLAAPPRVLAIVEQPRARSFADVEMPPGLGVYLAGVGDPGNVGTIVRSAAALGATWLALGPGSADPWHPRAARAAMGSTFSIPMLEGVAPSDLATRDGVRVVVASATGGVAPWEVDLSQPHVLALGGERHGLRDAIGELGERVVAEVTIPQAAGTDSLNVSAAAAALLGEIRRQRAMYAPAS